MLALIAQGMTNKEVARRLARSPRAVEHQFSAVHGKLNAANRMEFVLRLRGEPWLLASVKSPQVAENLVIVSPKSRCPVRCAQGHWRKVRQSGHGRSMRSLTRRGG